MPTSNYAPRRTRSRKVVDDCYERFASTVAEFSATLAAHNERLDGQESVATAVQQDIRDLRRQQATDTATLHSRIDGVREELTKRLDEQTDKLTDAITIGLEKVSTARNEDAKRIGSLENWKWWLLGGAALTGLVVFDVIIRIFYQPISQFFLQHMK